MARVGVELLWGTANLFGHPRYAAGAATNPDPEVFAFAAAQVKQALEATHGLGVHNYVAQKVDGDKFDDYTWKVDWHFGDADNLSSRYLYNDRFQDNPFNGSDLPHFGRSGTQVFNLLGLTPYIPIVFDKDGRLFSCLGVKRKNAIVQLSNIFQLSFRSFQ